MHDLEKINKALNARAKIEARIKELQASIVEEVTKLSYKLDTIDAYLAASLSDQIPKITVPAGTIERVPTTYYNVGDWELFLREQFKTVLLNATNSQVLIEPEAATIINWLISEGPTQFLKRDVKRTAVQEYVDKYKQPPVGIKSYSENKLKVSYPKRKAYDVEQ